jgi:hypothetical protein
MLKTPIRWKTPIFFSFGGLAAFDVALGTRPVLQWLRLITHPWFAIKLAYFLTHIMTNQLQVEGSVLRANQDLTRGNLKSPSG